jgi:hypothetical protein
MWCAYWMEFVSHVKFRQSQTQRYAYQNNTTSFATRLEWLPTKYYDYTLSISLCQQLKNWHLVVFFSEPRLYTAHAQQRTTFVNCFSSSMIMRFTQINNSDHADLNLTIPKMHTTFSLRYCIFKLCIKIPNAINFDETMFSFNSVVQKSICIETKTCIALNWWRYNTVMKMWCAF